jgi:four helix bundle protein
VFLEFLHVNSTRQCPRFMKITRFEEIKAWQEARKLVKLVYDTINNSEKFSKDLRLVNQMQGAAVSCMSNIAEGFARKGKREFVQYLFISKSSAAEVQSQLYVALDQSYVRQDEFNNIYAQADIVSKMDSAFIKYLNSQLNKLKEPRQPR